MTIIKYVISIQIEQKSCYNQNILLPRVVGLRTKVISQDQKRCSRVLTLKCIGPSLISVPRFILDPIWYLCEQVRTAVKLWMLGNILLKTCVTSSFTFRCGPISY